MPLRHLKFLVASLTLASAMLLQAQNPKPRPDFLGNILSSGTDPDFTRYWDQYTPENAGKWGVAEPTRDAMNLGTLDAIHTFGETNNLIPKFHTFLWFSQAPNWTAALSTADKLAEVTEWIDLIAARYPDFQYIDVANEVQKGTPDYATALGGAGATGFDWVRWGFNYVRPKYPNAKLLTNDYNVEESQHNGIQYMQLIKHVKSTGNLDGIGFQAHFLENASARNIQTMMVQYQAFDLPLHVTEFDLNISNDTSQLNKYKELIPVLWHHPQMEGFTLWGYKQGQIWQTNAWLLSTTGVERPALTWLMQYTKDTIAKDTSPPTAPTLTVTPGISHHTLNWTASTDNIQVGTYAIYRNGKIISAVRGNVTTFEDRGSWPDLIGYKGGDTVSYQVVALDSEYNSAASSIVTATSPAQPAFIQNTSGHLVIEAESYTALAPGNGASFGGNSINMSGNAWTSQAVSAASGSGNNAVGTTNSNVHGKGWQQAPMLNYSGVFDRTGPHHAWLRVRHPSSGNKNILAAFDRVPVTLWSLSASTSWQWRKCPLPINVATIGYHEFQLHMGTTGLQVDKIFITSDITFTPTSTGPAQSLSDTEILEITPSTVSITEGNSGISYASIHVSRISASTEPVSVNFTTANGSATAGTDYTATSGTLHWASGDSASKTILVPILGDTTSEFNENFTLTLSDPTTGVLLRSSTATVTITNDDEPLQLPYRQDGLRWPIPGKLQGENYDLGGPGVAYSDTDTSNSASTTYRVGEHVDASDTVIGWTAAGEWLEFSADVTRSGRYQVVFRVASGASGGNFRVLVNGVNVTGTASVGGTGDWGNYVDVTSLAFDLQVGQPIVRLEFITGGINLDWIEFIPVIETFANYMASYPSLTGNDAAPNADPDHDGIPNLLEQWFALAPNSHDLASDHFGMIAESENPFFQVTYNDSFRDSILSIQQSDNLITWQDVTLNPAWISDTASTRTLKVPIAESPQKTFSRIKVSF